MPRTSTALLAVFVFSGHLARPTSASVILVVVSISLFHPRFVESPLVFGFP